MSALSQGRSQEGQGRKAVLERTRKWVMGDNDGDVQGKNEEQAGADAGYYECGDECINDRL